ncbi:hypothetical protein [Pectobacterium brasiliense]|nr:hypothetical protein [Pectobacterium brasiliense]
MSIRKAGLDLGKTSGTLKLIVERLALPHLIEPLIPAFRQA